MERYSWRGKVKDGCMAEYEKRHDQIWPEMKEVLKKAGIVNYTIFADGNNLFGYYECSLGEEFAIKTQVSSPVVAKWEAFMQDILIFENKNSDKPQPKLREVFRLD